MKPAHLAACSACPLILQATRIPQLHRLAVRVTPFHTVVLSVVRIQKHSMSLLPSFFFVSGLKLTVCVSAFNFLHHLTILLCNCRLDLFLSHPCALFFPPTLILSPASLFYNLIFNYTQTQSRSLPQWSLTLLTAQWCAVLLWGTTCSGCMFLSGRWSFCSCSI